MNNRTRLLRLSILTSRALAQVLIHGMWLPHSENPTQKQNVPLLEYESSGRVNP
jgi:hypothetical protein